MTALKYTTKSGGTSSIHLQSIAVEIQDRCIRFENKQSTEEVLEFTTRPDSISNRCISTEMVEERNVSISIMEIDSTSHITTSKTKDTEGSINHTKLAHTILVSTDHPITLNTTVSTISTQRMDDDRAAVIRQKRKHEGIDEDATKFLEKSIKNNTTKLHNGGWRKLATWCNSQNLEIDPTKYDVRQVFQFLMANKQFSTSHLNGIRSAIASTFKTLHPKEMSLAEQPIIVEFFKAKRHQEIEIPTKNQGEFLIHGRFTR